MHVLRYKWMYHNTNLALKTIRSITGCITTIYFRILIIGSTCILNLLAGKYSEDTRKKGKFKARKRASHDWRIFYLSQCDWLKSSHMTKVVWLPNETDYSHCEFVAPNTPYCRSLHALIFSLVLAWSTYIIWPDIPIRSGCGIMHGDSSYCCVPYILTGD